MANHNASDIRQILNLIESVQSTILNEGPFTGLKAAFGDGAAQGELQRADLADRMKKEWSVWLGQTGRQGDIDDMVQYLHVRVGLEPNDIRVIMGYDQLTRADPENTYRPGTVEPEEEDPDTEFGRRTEDDPEEPEDPELPAATDTPNSYNSLTPAQKEELERNGKITLPGGKTLWVGKPGDEAPATIRAVKDVDIPGAADYLTTMSDEDFESFIKRAADENMKKRDLGKLRDELLRRSEKLDDRGRTAEASDLEDMVSRLEKEVGLNTNESILIEGKLNSKQANMVFDAAAKYVFANGVLNRDGREPSRRNRSRGGYDDGDVEDDDTPQGMSSKVRAFLRQNDVTDEMVHSLRETSRRARGLGSFKGAQDHKVLAMIGLAYLKYRD